MKSSKRTAGDLPQSERTADSRRSLREESQLTLVVAAILVLLSLVYCGGHNLLLLYGDAVAHLHIARRIFDSLNPGIVQLGAVWLPLLHLLLVPFVQPTLWWQSGVGGAVPSIVSYVLACTGLYRLARRWMQPQCAALVFLAFALNPNLLYMSVTAMTESLYLALAIWSVVHLTAFESALRQGDDRAARRALWKLVLVLIAAVFTRYDGWILGFLAWVMVAYWVLRHRWWNSKSNTRVLTICTLLLMAAPLAWFGYNWHFFGDPLNFMRGPYSAQAIAARTTPPGSAHYPGWDNPWWAFLYFMKVSKMVVAPLGCGRWLLLIAWLGTLEALWKERSRVVPAVVLFWMPVLFYTYSVAYGAVPIFLPVWFPHSFYNTRYGMELLPAFALFPAFAVRAGVRHWPRWRKGTVGFAVAVIVVNSFVLLRRTPLVLEEAKVNSTTRIPFERALAAKLIQLPRQSILLMDTSTHVGALERIGFPLRQTINEGDYPQWQQALKNPAEAADFVVAIAGDPVAKAVEKHPGNLELLNIICSTGEPCARLYRSTERTP